MFDIGWSEMLVIVVVALVVIGPKDLPRLIREVGRWTAKARGMAREFQRSFDDMVREAELDDIRKTVEQARPGNLTKTIRDAIDPEGELDEAFALEETRKSRPATPGKPGADQPPAGEAEPAAAAEAVTPAPPADGEPVPAPLPSPAVQAGERERVGAAEPAGREGGS
jgi:sec-independent protein translocase protein TatB